MRDQNCNSTLRFAVTVTSVFYNSKLEINMKKIIVTTLFMIVLCGILGCTGKPGQQNMRHRGGAAVDTIDGV